MSEVYQSDSAVQTTEIGEAIGRQLRGGEVIELVSDLGGGKTTLVRGLAQGFGSPDPVASPSFTINYVYGRSDGRQLYHYDFYRLDEAGIVGSELAEAQSDPNNVIVVEWGDIVHEVLPESRVTLHVKSIDERKRLITVDYPKKYDYLFAELKERQ